MEIGNRVVKKGGFKFKRSKGLSLNKPPPAVPPSDNCGIQIIGETKPPPKVQKNGGSSQMSIMSFAHKAKPVATVNPHSVPCIPSSSRSPPRNTSKRKREVPAQPALGMFVASVDGEDDLDDFSMPSINHVSPRATKTIQDNRPKTCTPTPRASAAGRKLPQPGNCSPNLDESSFSNSLMEDLFKDSEDEDELPQQISKRARHTPIIMSDSEDEEQKVMQPVPKTKGTADRKFSFHAAQGPARSSHQAPCTDRSSSSVKMANLDITPIKTESQSTTNSMQQKISPDNLDYKQLVSVMDEVCDIISKVSSADLMDIVSHDYDRLQKLLYLRKQLKERLGPQSTSSAGRRDSDSIAGRSFKNDTLNSESRTLFSPQPSSSRLCTTFKTPDISHSLVKTPLPVTSTAIKKTTATKMQLGSDSPIPCGDSFFEDDVELTQSKMSYMKGFRKSLTSPKNSPTQNTSDKYNSISQRNSLGGSVTYGAYSESFQRQEPRDPFSVSNSVNMSSFQGERTSVMDDSAGFFNDTSKHGGNYTFEYSLQEGPAVGKMKPSKQSTVPSPANNSAIFDDDFPDDLYNIEDFQDMQTSQDNYNRSNSQAPPFSSSVSAHTAESRSTSSFSSSRQERSQQPDLSSVEDVYQPMFAGTDKDDGASGMFDGHVFPHSKELIKVFKQVFGLREFRHNQLQAINASLLGLDTFILMPTGGGKSLCYQLPALVTNGVSVVISPLRALIQDQVQRLISLDIPAAHLSSDIDQAQAQNVYHQLSKREPGIKLLYVTPEKLSASAKLLESLRHLYDRKLLDRFIIDEAHCVSQWGHDFRPDYKKLNILRDKFGGVPMMALTATATPRVRKDILHQLGMKDPKWFMQSFNRPNLKYLVLNKRPKSTTPDVIKFIKDKYPRDYGIVYCLSRNECDNVAKDLQKAGVDAVSYHAGLADTQRVTIQDKWLYGERCKVICATIAFGMGIDKPDVRFVIHYSLPKSVEGYYQEAGRAGRDGLLSECVLFYSYQDVKRLRRMVEMDQNATYASKRVHIDNLYRMVQYAENVADCRRAQVLQYFGEHHFDRDRCNEFRGSVCDNCDSKDKFQLRDVTEDAKAVVKCVGELTSGRRNFTMLHFVEVFKGSKNTKIQETGHDRHPLHGRGSAYSRQDAERLFRKLVIDCILMEDLQITAMEHAVCYIKQGKRSAELMQGKIKVELAVHGSKSRTEVAKIGQEAQSDYDKLLDECYKELLAMAKTIAREHNIKNYTSVFTNQILWQLADKRPLTLEEMKSSEIDGLTNYRISAYGAERFLDITTKYCCMFSTLEDDRRCSSQKDEGSEEAMDEWTSHYFEESQSNRGRGGGRRGGSGWRGKKNYRGKKAKRGSTRGKSSGKKSNSSFNQYSYTKGKKAAASSRTTPPARSASSSFSGLGMMPAPQPRTFLASNMFLIKKK
ncbi:Bloom syndrome protein homolog [Haliotis rufescens]|uniref:Bloom syndrome protein homolog n=1 Tax=Haliotis rufescens TaxID=6454 RepID=UPI00201FB0E1|nr:Bloom syndrome protein homolog [Haliotis rufescens]